MTENKIAEILSNCENAETSSGFSPGYKVSDDTYREQKSSLFKTALPVVTKPVELTTDGEEIFIVSDLHIAAGRNPWGIYKGTENFFADDSFGRFLEYADTTKNSDRAILIINGDVFDFIRIVDYPGRVRKIRFSKRIKNYLRLNFVKNPPPLSPEKIAAQFTEWREILGKIGIQKENGELSIITRREQKYGLKTHEYKSVWKLNQMRKGHPAFFEALAKWLRGKNKIIILKGNHDVEWYWPSVRNYFRLLLAEIICPTGGNLSEALQNIVIPNVMFIDDSIEIDKTLYVEHGHRYDKFTMPIDGPLINREELNIPFGSFFNRYLLNRVELFYPFLDNVRPSGNILPILMRENFVLGLKILTQHVPLTIRMLFTLKGRYIKFMFDRIFWFIVALVLPVIIFLAANFASTKAALIWISSAFDFIIPAMIKEQTGTLLKSAGALLFSYLFSRFVAWAQLTEPATLDKYARERFKYTECKIMAMGHTHNPGTYFFEKEGRYFYNTGTWIPVIETSNAELREDKTYTFLHLERDASNNLFVPDNGLLKRWDDESGRAETQLLIERK